MYAAGPRFPVRDEATGPESPRGIPRAFRNFHPPQESYQKWFALLVAIHPVRWARTAAIQKLEAMNDRTDQQNRRTNRRRMDK